MIASTNSFINILDVWQKPRLMLEYYQVDGTNKDIFNAIMFNDIVPINAHQITYSDGIWYGIPRNKKHRNVAWLNKPENMNLPLSQFIHLIDFKIHFMKTLKGTICNTFTTIIITSNISLTKLYPELKILKRYRHIQNWFVQFHVEKKDFEPKDSIHIEYPDCHTPGLFDL